MSGPRSPMDWAKVIAQVETGARAIGILLVIALAMAEAEAALQDVLKANPGRLRPGWSCNASKASVYDVGIEFDAGGEMLITLYVYGAAPDAHEFKRALREAFHARFPGLRPDQVAVECMW